MNSFDDVIDDVFQTFLPFRVLQSNGDPIAIEDGKFEIVVAGVPREDIKVSAKKSERILTVEWKRKGKSVQQRYRLPKNVNPEEISTALENGILTIHLPTSIKKEDEIQIAIG